MHWLLAAVLVLGGASFDAAPVFAGGDRPGGPRVRPHDDRVARLLQEGLERSATLRALARRVEAGDVIVYLESEPRLEAHLAGGITWIATAGGFRYVRVSLSTRLHGDAAIATLGHELQHVVEILEAPHVVCALSLLNHFRTIGLSRSRDGHAWDTIAAQDTGLFIRRELGRTAARTAEAG